MRAFLGVFVAVLFCSSLHAQGPISPFVYKIKLAVTSDDSTEDLLKSSLAKSFRSLDRVEVVDDERPENELRVVAVKMNSGLIAVAVVLESHPNHSTILFTMPNCNPTDKQIATANLMLEDQVIVDDTWVFVGPIETLASRIAAAVDVQHIEISRQVYRRVKDYWDKHPSSKKDKP